MDMSGICIIRKSEYQAHKVGVRCSDPHCSLLIQHYISEVLAISSKFNTSLLFNISSVDTGH